METHPPLPGFRFSLFHGSQGCKWPEVWPHDPQPAVDAHPCKTQVPKQPPHPPHTHTRTHTQSSLLCSGPCAAHSHGGEAPSTPRARDSLASAGEARVLTDRGEEGRRGTAGRGQQAGQGAIPAARCCRPPSPERGCSPGVAGREAPHRHLPLLPQAGVDGGLGRAGQTGISSATLQIQLGRAPQCYLNLWGSK